MKKLTCPKCGMEVIGGSGFWGTSKPYCSFCGWNLQLAKEIERESLRQFPRNLLLFARFFAFVGYLSKSGFAFFPFLFLSVFVVGRAIVSWRKLKLLEVSHPAVAYANTLPWAMAAKENIKKTPVNTHLYLSALSKPRMVRFKPVARVLLFALIWSVIGITIIRSARRDRKLLAEGDVAMAIVTHQELIRGKHRRSQIRYEFRDASGRLVQGKGTDESWGLYEDMEAPILYNPTNPSENVTLCAATCELRID